MRMPGSFHATRLAPQSAGLGISLHHVGGWTALSITASPQTLELELANRTPHALTAGPAHLRLQFRPGVLTTLDQIVLAPQSEAAWTLAVEHGAAGDDVILKLAGVDRFKLAPGEVITVRLDGVSADPVGGSRATRVQVHYGRLFQASGAEVTGSRLLHLPVLRRHGPPTPGAGRFGSIATCGPFMAGFIDASDLLNDGKSANTLRLRIVNTSGHAIALSDDGDEATRFHLSFRTGVAPARWGLVETQTDHVSLAPAEGTQQRSGKLWQLDHHTLRRVKPGRWRPLETLDLDLSVHTSAPAGETWLTLTYENLPDEDDGDLVLPVRLGPTAARPDALVSVVPVELRGAQARLSFHPEEVLGTARANLPAPAIEVNRSDGTVGRLDVHAPAGLHIEGDLAVSGVLQPPASFKLGGIVDRYYPVAFDDLAWDRGELRLQIFRADTHADGTWHGSLMASIACHGDAFGHGSGYWSIDVHQWSADGPHRRFVGGFANDPYRPVHVIWLAGATTYYWRAGHPARIAAAVNLAQPGDLTLGTGQTQVGYRTQTAPAAGFAADHVSICRLTGRTDKGREEDASPVPVGAILLWPASESRLPLGWAVCDGSQGAPNLSAVFPAGLKYICKLG